MENVIFQISGISCPSCSGKIEKFLAKKFGDKVETSFNMNDFSMSIDYDPSITVEELQQAIKDSGYTATVVEE